jgi:GNAT superfamily N-acetyltransferase
MRFVGVLGRLDKYLADARSFPADAALAWRHERWRGVWDALAPRSVHRVFRRGRLTVFAQPLAAAREVPPPPGVRLAPLAEENWPALQEVVTRRDLERFRRLADLGHLCILAWRGSRPIGYAWVALRMEPEVSLCPVPLPADAAYLWDLYVVPAERSSGVGSALAGARLRLARERGYRVGWRMIERSNHASLRTLVKSGGTARVVGEVRYVKLLSRMHTRFAPAAQGGGGLP